MSLTVLPGTTHREDDMALEPEVIAGLWRMELALAWNQAKDRRAPSILAVGVRP